MTVTVNGTNATKVELHEPLFGAWMADVEADTQADITGQVTLSIEGVDFIGTVFRGGIESGHWEGRIIAGAAGLGTALTAKQYISVNVRGLLTDIATATGETLDTTNSDAAALTRVVPKWHRMVGTAGAAVRMLLREIGHGYRVSRAGEIVVGTDTFPEVTLGDEVVTETKPALGIRIIAPLTPGVRPGTTYDGERVSYVVTRATAGGLRQELWRV